MKESICYHALRLFDRYGYHGTSMRDIGNAVGCTMPTLYHYFGSKENLFDEVVRVAYISLVDRLRQQLRKGATPQEVCANSLIQKKSLTENELLIHRLALKTWLGCEGPEPVRRTLIEWEHARNAKNEFLLKDRVSPIWLRLITGIFFNLTERIVIFEENIPDDEIKEEFRLLFKAATIIT